MSCFIKACTPIYRKTLQIAVILAGVIHIGPAPQNRWRGISTTPINLKSLSPTKGCSAIYTPPFSYPPGNGKPHLHIIKHSTNVTLMYMYSCTQASKSVSQSSCTWLQVRPGISMARMYIHTSVRMSVYMYVRTCIYVKSTCIYICIYVCIHLINTNIKTDTYEYVRTYDRSYVRTLQTHYLRTYDLNFRRLCIRACMSTYIHTYITYATCTYATYMNQHFNVCMY